MSKLPAFQFYPADWRKDPSVQALSYFDKGVWFEILCLMHESEQRGKLLLNGKPMPDEALSRLLGLDKQILTKALTTLLDYGVASRDEQGALISRRMVRDENLRQIRTESGKKGGNPNLVNQNSTKPKKEVNQKSTPSSSTSSSISNTEEEKETTIVVSKKRRAVQLPEDFAVDEEMRLWATENVPHLNIRLETKQFIDYYKSKGETAKDWTAKWRTWQRNAFTDFGKFPDGKPSLNQNNGVNNGTSIQKSNGYISRDDKRTDAAISEFHRTEAIRARLAEQDAGLRG